MERREGDWKCPDTSCGNINFSKRTKCNRCGTLKPQVEASIKSNISKNDWNCLQCGNLNWARRTHCNICNTAKTLDNSERLGKGGGHFDLQDPADRLVYDSEGEEYDEFGRFLGECAPSSVVEVKLETLSGEVIAVDASTSLYQFTIAIRESAFFSTLTNSKGESTSHISGLMNRCLRILEVGIKPIFVFDSAPPDLKLRTLVERKERREEAARSLEEAKELDDRENIKKLTGRTVRVSKEQNESAKQLLRLMGVPTLDAKEEAEAQCAYLVKQGLANLVASEDADSLVFGCGVLIRNMTASSKSVLKINLQVALVELDLTREEFIDFCILCGCDYCGTIKGIGPKTAYSLIKKYKNIETVLRVKSETLEGYKEARDYFLRPQVNVVDEIKQNTIDPEGLKNFLVVENNFNEERVDKFIERLLKIKTKKIQLSLTSFFKGSGKIISTTNKDKKERGKGIGFKKQTTSGGGGKNDYKRPFENKSEYSETKRSRLIKFEPISREEWRSLQSSVNSTPMRQNTEANVHTKTSEQEIIHELQTRLDQTTQTKEEQETPNERQVGSNLTESGEQTKDTQGGYLFEDTDEVVCPLGCCSTREVHEDMPARPPERDELPETVIEFTVEKKVSGEIKATPLIQEPESPEQNCPFEDPEAITPRVVFLEEEEEEEEIKTLSQREILEQDENWPMNLTKSPAKSKLDNNQEHPSYTCCTPEATLNSLLLHNHSEPSFERSSSDLSSYKLNTPSDRSLNTFTRYTSPVNNSLLIEDVASPTDSKLTTVSVIGDKRAGGKSNSTPKSHSPYIKPPKRG